MEFFLTDGSFEHITRADLDSWIMHAKHGRKRSPPAIFAMLFRPAQVKKPARHNEREFKKRTNEEVKAGETCGATMETCGATMFRPSWDLSPEVWKSNWRVNNEFVTGAR